MFDLEQGKISVRLSEGVYNQLKADIVFFAFKKEKGGWNENAFFNKLIPNLIDYRTSKRNQLRDYIKDNFECCIKDEFREKVYYVLDDIFNTVYFNDYNENYHSLRIHFRLNKENIINLNDFFVELETKNIKKTSYIRNLLNEYCDMNRDKREWLCFKTEFDWINSSQPKVSRIEFEYRNKYYSICLYTLELHKITNEWFVIGFDMNKPFYLRAFRLCELKDITFGEDVNLTLSKDCQCLIDEYIDSSVYSKKNFLNLKTKGVTIDYD
jgi:hypothetical protein